MGSSTLYLFVLSDRLRPGAGLRGQLTRHLGAGVQALSLSEQVAGLASQALGVAQQLRWVATLRSQAQNTSRLMVVGHGHT